MPLFKCSKCGCVENTATSNYWNRTWDDPPPPPLCSECDPEIGKWHGQFEKESAKGMVECDDGFLYSEDELKPGGYFHGKQRMG